MADYRARTTICSITVWIYTVIMVANTLPNKASSGKYTLTNVCIDGSLAMWIYSMSMAAKSLINIATIASINHAVISNGSLGKAMHRVDAGVRMMMKMMCRVQAWVGMEMMIVWEGA